MLSPMVFPAAARRARPRPGAGAKCIGATQKEASGKNVAEAAKTSKVGRGIEDNPGLDQDRPITFAPPSLDPFILELSWLSLGKRAGAVVEVPSGVDL
jgi:hypothetical protein